MWIKTENDCYHNLEHVVSIEVYPGKKDILLCFDTKEIVTISFEKETDLYNKILKIETRLDII